MNKISTIQNVLSFKFDNELCLFFDKDNIAYLNNQKIVLPEFNIDTQSSSVFGDFYSIQSKSGETALYSRKGNKAVLETEYTLVKNFIHDKGTILFSEKTDKRRHRKFHLFDINLNVFTIRGSSTFQVNHSFFVENSLFFSDSLMIIQNLHLPTETTLWQFDSSELGIEKISKVMGVFGEVLVVVGLYENPDPRYSDQYELFMGIDINTGSLLWQQKEVLINEKMSPLGGLSFNLQFQNGGLTLEALLGEYYWTLNSQTGEITAVSIKDQLDDIGLWVAMSSAISATHLYFRAQVHALGGFAKCIGSFNLETKKIDWFHIFEEFNQTGAAVKNNQPKVDGNKIYALDTNNTLHIFERE